MEHTTHFIEEPTMEHTTHFIEEPTIIIPFERLVELVDCETRLNILRQSRIREIKTTSYQSVSNSDFILGKPVMDEWERQQAVEGGNA